jgi:hypothetical protein
VEEIKNSDQPTAISFEQRIENMRLKKPGLEENDGAEGLH